MKLNVLRIAKTAYEVEMQCLHSCHGNWFGLPPEERNAREASMHSVVNELITIMRLDPRGASLPMDSALAMERLLSAFDLVTRAKAMVPKKRVVMAAVLSAVKGQTANAVDEIFRYFEEAIAGLLARAEEAERRLAEMKE